MPTVPAPSPVRAGRAATARAGPGRSGRSTTSAPIGVGDLANRGDGPVVGRHTSWMTITSAARSASTAAEVVGLAHAVAAGPEPVVGVEAGDVSSGIDAHAGGHPTRRQRRAGRRTAKRAPPSGRRSIVDGAAVPLGDRPHHRQPEADAAAVAGAALVEAGEPVEDPLAVSAGMPGPSSSTMSSTGRRRWSQLDRHRVLRVAGGVVEQVAHDPAAAARGRPCTRPADTRGGVDAARGAAARCRRARARRGRPRAPSRSAPPSPRRGGRARAAR